MIKSKMDDQNQFGLLQAILNQIKDGGPGLKQLIERQIKDNLEKGVIYKEIIRRLRIQNKKLLEQVASLKKKLKKNSIERNQIMGKLNDFRKLNISLADALGSCHSCWGEDPECSACSGEGVPGWQRINKRLFNLYILPALEKLKGKEK